MIKNPPSTWRRETRAVNKKLRQKAKLIPAKSTQLLKNTMHKFSGGRKNGAGGGDRAQKGIFLIQSHAVK